MKRLLLLAFIFLTPSIVYGQDLGIISRPDGSVYADVTSSRIPVVNCGTIGGTCYFEGTGRSVDSCYNGELRFLPSGGRSGLGIGRESNTEDYLGYCEGKTGGVITGEREDCCVRKGTVTQEKYLGAQKSFWMSPSICEDPSGLAGQCVKSDTAILVDFDGSCTDSTYSRSAGYCGVAGANSTCCITAQKASEITEAATGVAPGITQSDYQLLELIPGSGNTSGKLQPYLESLYRAGFVLIILGAIFMITVGGFTYMASAGNTYAIKKGKGMITDAILGLVVALFVWLILNIINPDLVKLEINPLKGLTFDPGGTGANTAAVQRGGGSIPCSTALTTLPADYNLKGGTNQICPALLTEIEKLKSVDGWRVTRLTGGDAQSQCHNSGNAKTGSCADVAFNPNPGFDHPKWDALCEAAARLSNVRVVNEASNSAACQKALGPFKKTPHQTGAHLHIDYNGGK
jgi:hypothetical protein